MKKQSNYKMIKKKKRHFIKEELKTVNKHMKRCSSLLVIRDMQMKTTQGYHCTPLRMVKIKNSNNNTYRRRCIWSRTLNPGDEIGSLTALLLGMWNGRASLGKFGNFIWNSLTTTIWPSKCSLYSKEVKTPFTHMFIAPHL